MGSSPNALKTILVLFKGDVSGFYNLEVFIFIIGVSGIVLNRKNILINILALELTLLSINLNFATVSLFIDDIIGQIFVLFVLAIAAAETSIGLALSAAFYRLGNSIELPRIFNIKKKSSVFKNSPTNY
jgi:NADH-quinone oxidoreductase subunit K